MKIIKASFAGVAGVSISCAQLVFVICLLLAGVYCDRGNPVISNNQETVTDADGNVYQIVSIGNQVWMAENLRTTKYNDGSAIPPVTDNAAWANDIAGAYCYYGNTIDAARIKKFGALYNWYAVNTNKLAPAGWHVPTDAEWDILQNWLIANGYNHDGTTTGNKIAKSLAAQTDWEKYADPGAIGNDLGKNNRSGFSALPGGCRFNTGSFFGTGGYGYWWSATETDPTYADARFLDYGNESLGRNSNTSYKSNGFSVRLVRD